MLFSDQVMCVYVGGGGVDDGYISPLFALLDDILCYDFVVYLLLILLFEYIITYNILQRIFRAEHFSSI